MGHEGVLTTFTSYGEVARERQARIIRSLADPAAPGSDIPGVEKVLELLWRSVGILAVKYQIDRDGCLRRGRRLPVHFSPPRARVLHRRQQWTRQ
jgi:hypothetical protein